MGDKKLAAVGAWSSICHSQATRLVKRKVRMTLVFELIARPTGAETERITALNHEIRNHPMKDRIAIQRRGHRLTGFRVRPLFTALRQACKISNRYRGLIGVELADDISYRGIKRGLNENLRGL